MKSKIYGRSVGFQGSMMLLMESNGVSTGGKQVSAFVVAEISIASAHRTVAYADATFSDIGINGEWNKHFYLWHGRFPFCTLA